MDCLQDFDGAGDGFSGGDQVPSEYQPYGRRWYAGVFALIAHAHGMAGCGGPGGRDDYTG